MFTRTVHRGGAGENHSGSGFVFERFHEIQRSESAYLQMILLSNAGHSRPYATCQMIHDLRLDPLDGLPDLVRDGQVADDDLYLIFQLIHAYKIRPGESEYSDAVSVGGQPSHEIGADGPGSADHESTYI